MKTWARVGLDFPAFLSDFESHHCYFTVLPVIDAKLQLMNCCSSLTNWYKSIMGILLDISQLS